MDEFISFASEAPEIQHIFSFNRIKRNFTSSPAKKLIVISGMPKSGISLFAALLDSHPQLEVFPQELRFFHLRLNELPPQDAAEAFFANANVKALFFRKDKTPTSRLTGSGGTEPILSQNEFELFKEKVNERFLQSRTARERFEAIMNSWMEIRGVRDNSKIWVVRAPRNERFSNLWLGMYRKNVLFIKLNRHHLEHFAGLRRYWAARRNNDFLTVEGYRQMTEESKLSFQSIPASQRLNVCLTQLRSPQHFHKEMKRTLDFLSLDWDDALTKTTFAGHVWVANRADGPLPGIAWKKGIDRQLIRRETTWLERLNLTLPHITSQFQRP